MANYYGTSTNTFDGLRDCVNTHLESLISAMESGYDPTIDNVYEYHSHVPIVPNAVSIGIAEVSNAKPYGLAGGTLHYYETRLTIRVHTGYIGDSINEQQIARLIQSIDNYFNTHKNLNASPRYVLTETLSINMNATFAESYTIGGEIVFAINISVQHDQS